MAAVIVVVTAAGAAVAVAVAIAIGIEDDIWDSGEALMSAVCKSGVTEAIKGVKGVAGLNYGNVEPHWCWGGGKRNWP